MGRAAAIARGVGTLLDLDGSSFRRSRARSTDFARWDAFYAGTGAAARIAWAHNVAKEWVLSCFVDLLSVELPQGLFSSNRRLGNDPVFEIPLLSADAHKVSQEMWFKFGRIVPPMSYLREAIRVTELSLARHKRQPWLDDQSVEHLLRLIALRSLIDLEREFARDVATLASPSSFRERLFDHAAGS